MTSGAASGFGPVPDALVDEFERQFAQQQQAQWRVWTTAARMWRVASVADRPFVADELALLMNVHPLTASSLLLEACRAADLPPLMASWEAGELTERHVRAALEELHRCLDDDAIRLRVLERVLTRCRERAATGHGWPRPGELRRMLRAAAILDDPDAARRREQAKTDDRRADCYPLPDGQAGFALEGPAEQVIACAEAIRVRATAITQQPGEQRTLTQVEFDLAVELLTTGTIGGQPPVVEIQVVMPLETATGDSDAPAELVGYGPITAHRARALLEQAARLRRITTHPDTADVVAVDDALPRTADLHADLQRLRKAPVVVRDLSSTAYRPTRRATRFVRTRDRTCRFPGCTQLASSTDLDHRLAWPHGPTSPDNLHCLCRHHHRAKQSGRFTVTRDPGGHTLWTTRRGRTYTCPPAELTPA